MLEILLILMGWVNPLNTNATILEDSETTTDIAQNEETSDTGGDTAHFPIKK